MAAEFLRRELSALQSHEAARAECCWAETSEARSNFLVQQTILDECSYVALNRELSLPENLTKENDSDAAFRSDGILGPGETDLAIAFIRDDACSVSDQDRSLTEGLAMEMSNALIARSKRWQERIPQLPGAGPALGSGQKPTVPLAAEADALTATLQGTQAHLAIIARMKSAVEEGMLQKQDKLDETEFKLAITRAKAAILKLQSLEYHFMTATYRAEDVVALNKIYEELTTRIEHLKSQLQEEQKALAVFRGLGSAFHEQLAQFRDVQRRLLDAQYMLENFNKINSELDDGAADMMMSGSHMDCDDGRFVVY